MQPDSAHKPLLLLVDSVHMGAATSHVAAFFVSARARTFDDAGRGFRHRSGQPLQDLDTVGNHGDVAKAAIPFLLKSMERFT